MESDEASRPTALLRDAESCLRVGREDAWVRVGCSTVKSEHLCILEKEKIAHRDRFRVACTLLCLKNAGIRNRRIYHQTLQY